VGGRLLNLGLTKENVHLAAKKQIEDKHDYNKIKNGEKVAELSTFHLHPTFPPNNLNLHGRTDSDTLDFCCQRPWILGGLYLGGGREGRGGYNFVSFLEKY